MNKKSPEIRICNMAAIPNPAGYVVCREWPAKRSTRTFGRRVADEALGLYGVEMMLAVGHVTMFKNLHTAIEYIKDTHPQDNPVSSYGYVIKPVIANDELLQNTQQLNAVVFSRR